jgi:glycosyltransferase involved in cell wall biosynthesis
MSRPERIRVCHVAATADGATWMVEQLRELRDKKGYEVSAIIAPGPGALAGKLERAGIPYQTFSFDFFSVLKGHALLSSVSQLARLFRAERYDIVQSHLFASMVLARLAAWLADVPVRLAMIAGPYHLEAYTPRWIDVSTAWMETGIIASCEYTRQLYLNQGIPADRLSVTFYGPDAAKFDPAAVTRVDLRSELHLPADARLVGMVAYFYPKLPASRWTPEVLHNRANKRHEDLIRAVPRIIADCSNAHVILAGSAWGAAGEEVEREAHQLVQSLGLTQHVHFLGLRTDVEGILADLDVAVQASLSENLGGTIESLLMQCPTVATRTGGMVDTVRDGETGILVRPLDPGDLADGVLRMLADPAQARALAQRGRQLMLDGFTLEQTVDSLDGTYARQLSCSRGYRPAVSLMRALLAVPVFGWLAVRLVWDTILLSRWDARQRAPRRGAQIGLMRRLGHAVPRRARRLMAGSRIRQLWDLGIARLKGGASSRTLHVKGRPARPSAP